MLHHVDVRLRQATTKLDRQAAQQAAAARLQKLKQIPTVKTEAQTRADEAAAALEKERAAAPHPSPLPRPRVKPLPESKAIDMGATFISEGFMFAVAGGLIVYESLRAKRKAADQKDQVTEQMSELERTRDAHYRGLVALETELTRLKRQIKGQQASTDRLLPEELWNGHTKVVVPEPEPWYYFGGVVRWLRGDNASTEGDAQSKQNGSSTPTPAAKEDATRAPSEPTHAPDSPATSETAPKSSSSPTSESIPVNKN